MSTILARTRQWPGLALVSAMACLAAGPTQAQKVAPGLWETTMSMKSGSGEMEAAMKQAQAQMASMPPEQRKMMEDMMARQGLGMGGKPNVVRVCVTKERAERDELPVSEDGRCQHKVQRSGATIKVQFSCAQPPSTGEGEFTLTSDKAYQGRMVVTSTVKGKPERMEMTQSSRWLGSDCGVIRPKAVKP